MVQVDTLPPLIRSEAQKTHLLIRDFIKRTPILTCTTLSALASTPQSAEALARTEWIGRDPARPKINLFFKCENLQTIGAFKLRGATSFLQRLGDEELAKGVVTHSSGNHAAALALAAKRRGAPAYIVMPRISMPNKIAATRSHGAEIVFSGSTAPEREAVAAEVMARTGATMVPPYDHPYIILGQGTLALEVEEQVGLMLDAGSGGKLDAVVAPLGGGGMLSGIATALSGTGIRVFGAEPSFQGGDDGRRGLAADPPERVTEVKTLTIADGLRTPVGVYPWSVISDREKVGGVFAVTEGQILAAMRLVLERMKVVIEPSSAVPLAVVLFNEDFRRRVEQEGGEQGWNICVVFSGGNTTVEAIGKLFAKEENEDER
ncbi:IlvA, threonine dehydratase [Eremomyces bilateralis CBS 781.70]|uniref:IlvA, threonine dehydratase n=1 Tax=Eremomyces bilateralis CBS 781.70 TaxID=1392243 RepID=A0A6G1G6W7_9PEZI|nr:IlvA, threonine dehydratase [Eremomyces bilateralis CBS 781.70]KAF1813774.1 IlvA, threonine dehydratase [Eremomyces bilateralis CBS 781.70]